MGTVEFQVEQGVLLAYGGTGSRVVIPEEVVEIAEDVFAAKGTVSGVTFGRQLRKIGARAFFRCTHLRFLLLPDSVKELGTRAFYGCEHMMSVKLPAQLRFIGDEAFAMCHALETVTIPDSVEQVGVGVFAGCRRLREVRCNDKWKQEHPELYNRLIIK